MRVIAGEAGSLKLIVPKGVRMRPTTDAVREALFSSLSDSVVDCAFLDIYAGTGSVGIEALSRGAASCVFIERHRQCMQAIHQNLANTGLAARATVIPGDARRVIERALQEHGPFGLVFIDPPYDDPTGGDVAAHILAGESLQAPGVLVFQHSRHEEPAGLPEPERVRRFGETMLSFYVVPGKGA